MENTGSKNNNKVFIWIAVGCLGIIVCAVAVVMFGFGGLVWLGSQPPPDNVTVFVGHSLLADVGDDVQITVSITNTSSESLKLDSIDFSLNYLEGINITQVDPPYTDITKYDSLGGGESFQSFNFSQTIEPNETLRVVFDAKAVLPGSFSGTVDVCIDSFFNCTTKIISTTTEK